MCDSRKAKTAFHWWLAWFTSEHGGCPAVDVLEVVDGSQDALNESERAWIAKHSATIFNFTHMPKQVTA
jgi:hypothetical protein